MVFDSELVVRDAAHGDLAAICQFGETHIPPHYAPLIGPVAANEQVRAWWNTTHISTAIEDLLVTIAFSGAELVGVAQRGRMGADHVIYKLYVHPEYRGNGLGPLLIDAVTSRLPADAERLHVEHFAGNRRAGSFYEREGFTVQRIDESSASNPALGTVWRARSIPVHEQHP